MLFTKPKPSLNKILFIILLFYYFTFVCSEYLVFCSAISFQIIDMQLLAIIAQMCSSTYTSTCIYGEKNVQVIIIIITTMVSPISSISHIERKNIFMVCVFSSGLSLTRMVPRPSSLHPKRDMFQLYRPSFSMVPKWTFPEM